MLFFLFCFSFCFFVSSSQRGSPSEEHAAALDRADGVDQAGGMFLLVRREFFSVEVFFRFIRPFSRLASCFLSFTFSLSLFFFSLSPIKAKPTHVCGLSSFLWNVVGRQSRRVAREEEEEDAAASEADTSSLTLGAASCCFRV